MRWLKEHWWWLIIWLLCAAFGAMIGATIGDYWTTKWGW